MMVEIAVEIMSIHNTVKYANVLVRVDQLKILEQLASLEEPLHLHQVQCKIQTKTNKKKIMDILIRVY